MEKITATRRAFDGDLVKVDVHDVLLPDGQQAKRELVQHPGAVAIVPVDDAYNVLMVRQYRIGTRRDLLEIPAGTLDPDETPEACAVREMREETGYRPTQLIPLGGFYNAPGYSSEYIHLFQATAFTHDPLEQDFDEFVTLEKLTLTDALSQIDNGSIVDGKTIIGLLRVARRLGQ